MRTEDGEEQWILAEVVSYNSHNHRYIVDDIDEEGHNEKRCVIVYIFEIPSYYVLTYERQYTAIMHVLVYQI